jgi:hypothetical protein
MDRWLENGTLFRRPRPIRPGPSARPCTARATGPPGGNRPRPAPAPPMGRALRPRRVGRLPLFFPDLTVCGTPTRAGGGNAVRFLVPPALTKARSPLQWQGPSPLPQRHAAPPPAGGQSPRPAPAPPPAGASRPPGRALACVVPGPAGLRVTVPRGRGKRSAFSDPAWRGKCSFNASMAGAIAPATAPRCPMSSRGSKPQASARPALGPGASPPPGRALSLVVSGPAGLQGTVAHGRGNAVRFPIPAR